MDVGRKGLSVWEILINDPKTIVVSLVLQLTESYKHALPTCTPSPHHETRRFRNKFYRDRPWDRSQLLNFSNVSEFSPVWEVVAEAQKASIIYQFNKFLLCTYCVPGTLLAWKWSEWAVIAYQVAPSLGEEARANGKLEHQISVTQKRHLSQQHVAREGFPKNMLSELQSTLLMSGRTNLGPHLALHLSYHHLPSPYTRTHTHPILGKACHFTP